MARSVVRATRDPAAQPADRPQRGEDAQFHHDGQEPGQAEPIEPAQLAEAQDSERHHAQAHRQRQGRRVERVLGHLAEPVEDPPAETHADERQECREGQIDHDHGAGQEIRQALQPDKSSQSGWRA